MRAIRVLMSSGEQFVTSINGEPETVAAYYLGKPMNMAGGDEPDRMATAIAVEFLEPAEAMMVPRGRYFAAGNRVVDLFTGRTVTECSAVIEYPGARRLTPDQAAIAVAANLSSYHEPMRNRR